MSNISFKLYPKIDVLCLTSGKCGSTTLCQTFRANGFKSIKAHSTDCFKSQFKYDGLIDLIDRSSQDKKLYIIDSYRTPIERKISSFFENIRKHVPNHRNKTVDELINIFNSKYLNEIEEYHSINPIMKHYGVEPFDTFDFNKRFIIKEKGNLVFIKILFSDINNWSNILSSIFNKQIVVSNGNISQRKSYKHIYNEFKAKYTTLKSYLNDKLIQDREFKIYNTQEEQEKYINKWLALAN
jgi:hypothetical protein